MDPNAVVRPGWSLEVAGVCQRAALAIWSGSLEQFRADLTALMRALPPPVTTAERLMLADRLRGFLLDSARQFDAAFHRRLRLPPCPGLPWEAVRAWPKPGPVRDPTAAALNWLSTFCDGFEAVHALPPVERAAKYLRSFPERPLDLDNLAHLAGCSRSALTRRFRATFGATVREYHTRLRVDRTRELLARGNLPIVQAAEQVGYENPKNLYEAFRRITGKTPGAVRHNKAQGSRRGL